MGRKSAVLKLTKEQISLEMKRFRTTTAYEVLCNLWTLKRNKIIEDGKKNPSVEAWERLRGCDDIIFEADRWADLNFNNTKEIPVED